MQEYINQEGERIYKTHWQFMYETWPIVATPKFHRTNKKDIPNISKAKEYVYNKLGIIPVFFFLTVVFSSDVYPGPYSNVEKGVLVLYHILKGCPVADMEEFIPKSSYYEIYKKFYITNCALYDKMFNMRLYNMFSSIKLRLLLAKVQNPPNFKQITMHLDGHDTRATYIHGTSEELFSFKLKKSGFRTQVLMDLNSMILAVSKSEPCKDNNDGKMFCEMKIDKLINEHDCIALDGRYTLHILKYLESCDILDNSNFCSPIRKQRNVDLTSTEVVYNNEFGTVRSGIEGIFGELGNTFHQFNNRRPIKVTEIKTFTLQFKLASLLLNIKKFCKYYSIVPEPEHSEWRNIDFDYPDGTNTHDYLLEKPQSITQKKELSNYMQELQESFLNLNTTEYFSHVEIMDK